MAEIDEDKQKQKEENERKSKEKSKQKGSKEKQVKSKREEKEKEENKVKELNQKIAKLEEIERKLKRKENSIITKNKNIENSFDYTQEHKKRISGYNRDGILKITESDIKENSKCYRVDIWQCYCEVHRKIERLKMDRMNHQDTIGKIKTSIDILEDEIRALAREIKHLLDF